MHESVAHWVLLEINIVDEMSSHAAPVSDHTFILELLPYCLLILLIIFGLFLDLVNSLEASLSAHELKDAVD